MWMKCDCADTDCGDNGGWYHDGGQIRGLQSNTDEDGDPDQVECPTNVVELEENDEVLNADTFEEVKVSIAMDSGCGKHVAPHHFCPDTLCHRLQRLAATSTLLVPEETGSKTTVRRRSTCATAKASFTAGFRLPT
jgi:hypothetical protein